MLDPTHPDVARVLHLLDDCDRCYGAPNGCCYPCNGHGKALHPDRVIGALRRYIFADSKMNEAGALDHCRAAVKHEPVAAPVSKCSWIGRGVRCAGCMDCQ